MNRRSQVWTTASILVLGSLVGYWFAQKRAYPCGPQPASLPIVVNALRSYAVDHNNCFPNLDSDPYRSLQALYPDYISAQYLAGISVDHKAVKVALSSRGTLNSNVCSLAYIPGLFLTNDPGIAIVWEKRPGLAFNGRRHAGRAVGFISGEVRQISDRDWGTFLSEQTSLRTVGVTNK